MERDEGSLDENLDERVLEIWLEDWERKRRVYVIQTLCLVVQQMCWIKKCYLSSHLGRSIVDDGREREYVRQELMKKLSSSESCRSIIRMGPEAFMSFCDLLKDTGNLRRTKNTSVEEQVAIFLYVIAHGQTTRDISFFFGRSIETISRHFHDVLKAVISLEEQFLKQPKGAEVPPQIRSNSRFYPYFKDCVGAIDGTHVRVKVYRTNAPRYIGRKDWPPTNILAACTFDMRFSYVLAGWEGTASDSRVLKNALDREDNLVIPRGKYYLVDSGFMLKSGLIAPYRGVRYHLKECSRHPPKNAKELFNLRHASLRNVIERTFGVLKKRFCIIASGTEPHYPVATHIEIILACCIVHNFLMGMDPDEELIAEVDKELRDQTEVEEDVCATSSGDEDARKGALIRDVIAATMWNDYVTR